MEWYNLLRIPPSAFQALILSFKYVMDGITHFDVVCDVK
jgi:cobalamin synthase